MKMTPFSVWRLTGRLGSALLRGRDFRQLATSMRPRTRLELGPDITPENAQRARPTVLARTEIDAATDSGCLESYPAQGGGF